VSRLFGELGVGVGLRQPHYEVFENERPKSVSWIEVISENFMAWQGREIGEAHQTLLRLRQDLPVALHGVSLSVGSVDPLNFDYLKRLKELTDILQPAIVSDHLCWTGVDGENFHDLLPIPYTEESLRLITDKVSKVQDFLGRRILLENPSSYLEFADSEMAEGEFLAELARRSDCGILLDVNNIYVSSVNHGFSAEQYLRDIPFERVGQIHLAGHSKQDGILVDTHDAPVSEDVWALFQRVTEQHGQLNAMIERDGNIPSWTELEKEISRIRIIQSEVRREAV
jgi:hypothetical protein